VFTIRSPGSPEITLPNVSPVIHDTFYKKLVTWDHQVLLCSQWGHMDHQRSHNRMYHQWYIVLFIRN